MKVVDGRQAYEANKFIPCVDGPDQVTFVNFTANSTNSTNQTYVINVPSLDTGLDRSIMYHWVGTATFACTAPTSPSPLPAYPGITIAFADEAADQAIATETAQIGSKQNSIQRSYCGVELSRVDTSSKLSAQFQSGSGGNYHDFAVSFAPWLLSNRNPIANPYDVSQNDYQPSPRTSDIHIIAVTNTSITVQFEIWFTSKVSPFLQSGCQLPAIRKLNNVQLNLQLESNLMRMFSIVADAGYAVTGFQTGVQFSVAEIWVQFITPSKFSLAKFTPIDDVYNYVETQVWPGMTTALNASVNPSALSTTQIALQQISATTIPDLILIGARPIQNQLSQAGAFQPRYWFPIDDGGVNLKFNNTTILNGATTRQLYEMSIENGLSGVTFEQFAGRDVTYNQSGAYATATNLVMGGSFMLINPAKDCQITNSGITNGSKCQWTLSGSVRVRNQTYDAQPNVELVVIAVYGGYLVSNGVVTAETGLYTPEESRAVLNNQTQALNLDSSKVYRRAVGYQGGAFLDSLKSFANKAIDFGLKNKDTIMNVGSAIAKHGLPKIQRGVTRFLGRGAIEEEDEYSGGAYLDTSSKAVYNKRSIANKYM
jgi:hypothetical protein